MPSESLYIHKPFQCFKYAEVGMRSMKDKGEFGVFYDHINFQNRCRGFLFVVGFYQRCFIYSERAAFSNGIFAGN